MKLHFLKLVVCIVALLAPGAVLAHGVKAGEIDIGHPYARAMLPGAKVGGGYLKLTNHGGPDRLVSISSDRAASVQIHEMKMDGGIMEMRELKGGIAIPADGTVEFKPGGYHLMFMKVVQPFKEGEMVKATLTFEKAGSVDVEFEVGPPAGAPNPQHHDHASGGQPAGDAQ